MKRNEQEPKRDIVVDAYRRTTEFSKMATAEFHALNQKLREILQSDIRKYGRAPLSPNRETR